MTIVPLRTGPLTETWRRITKQRCSDMASGRLPLGEIPERPGEPDTGTPSDDPTAFQGNSSEAETAPAGTKAERSSPVDDAHVRRIRA